jgi:nicotinamidase-related amidase
MFHSLKMSIGNNGRRLVGKLVPENSVFLLCDIQNRFRPLTWRGETVINTARYLTSVAKALEIPVVITQQYTKVFGDTVKDCFADPSDIDNYPVVEKKQFSMCVDEVNKELNALNRNSVVLFGIEAHVCVQQTCLDLIQEGKEVHLIVDATSSQQSYDREIALQRMSQAGAFITTAQSAAFMLMRTAEHENFKKVSKLTVEHMKLPNEFNETPSGKL